MSTTIQGASVLARSTAPPDGPAPGRGEDAGASIRTNVRASARQSTGTVGGTGSTAGQADSSGPVDVDSAGGPASTRALEAPKPLRFPWLSRLARELEPTAKTRAAFASAPVLGDHVARQA